ncbi:MAG: hypothetical protein SFY66_11915 [Oculatellaceae cyanobacterium bins.114]|nr:hypothetical protein [Oculatellaceae cyanobacterium bins.114]
MPRPKRSSPTLQKAEKREAALESLSPTLDLGNGLTVETYSTLIQALRTQITTYNTALSNLDDLSRQIKGTEQQLRDLSEQMLLGVAAKYGKNSSEYGKAGGVPKSERRRSTRKPLAAISSVSEPTVMATSTNEAIAASVNGNGKTLVS